MILPSKVVDIDKSLIGIGSVIIQLLKNPLTVSRLWEATKKRMEINSFEYFILTLDFLYVIGAVSLKNGRIYRGRDAL